MLGVPDFRPGMLGVPDFGPGVLGVPDFGYGAAGFTGMAGAQVPGMPGVFFAPPVRGVVTAPPMRGGIHCVSGTVGPLPMQGMMTMPGGMTGMAGMLGMAPGMPSMTGCLPGMTMAAMPGMSGVPGIPVGVPLMPGGTPGAPTMMMIPGSMPAGMPNMLSALGGHGINRPSHVPHGKGSGKDGNDSKSGKHQPSGGQKRAAIFIGNLPYDVLAQELKDIFCKVGTVRDVRVVLDQGSRQPKGYAFLEYASLQVAQDALRYLWDAELRGRRLRLDLAEKGLNSSEAAQSISAGTESVLAVRSEDFCVMVSRMPKEWTEKGPGKIPGHVTAKLTTIGPLAESPKVQDGNLEVIVKFQDAAHAKEAVEKLSNDELGVRIFVEKTLPAPAPSTSTAIVAVDDVAAKAADRRGRTVFVGNLPFDATEGSLNEICSRAGEVDNVRIVYERDRGQTKGYAFCDYRTTEGAENAVKSLGDVEMGGRALRISMADAGLGQNPRHLVQAEVRGFPARWPASEVEFFVRKELKGKAAPLGITLLPRDDKTALGSATVGFASMPELKKACVDLNGRRVGKEALTVFVEGVALQDMIAQENLRRDASPTPKRPVKKDAERKPPPSPPRSPPRRIMHLDGRKMTVDIVLHLDELEMPSRPCVEPTAADREVFADPLPDDAGLKGWAERFGEFEEVYRLPRSEVSKPGERGYVKFKEHDAAKKCVDEDCGNWSESERALASQRRENRESSYPDSVIGRLVGSGGDRISSIKNDIGASLLSLRGEGLGSDHNGSKRLHYYCRVIEDATHKVRPALESELRKVHAEIRARIEDPDSAKQTSQNDLSGATKAWKPPGSGGGRPPGRHGDGRPSPGRPQPWHPPGAMPLGPPPGPWAPPGAPYGPPPGWGPHGAPPYGPPPGWGPPGAPLLGPPPGAWPGPAGPPPGAWPGPGGAPPPGLWRAPAPHVQLPPPADGAGDGAKERKRRKRSRSRSRSRRKRRRRDAASEEEDGAAAEAPAGGAAAAAPSGGTSAGEPAGPTDGEVSGSVELDPFAAVEKETELVEAVLIFLRDWSTSHEKDVHPNLIHLGADPNLRDIKAAALPSSMAWKTWLMSRLSHEVDVVGQNVVLLS